MNAPAGLSHNLPNELTSFVGRRRDAERARELLGRSRLLTVTGPGGVGKTRFAIRVASSLLRTFKDGVWLVELAGVRDPGLLAEAVGDVLGIRDEGLQTPAATLARHLATSRTLLVLDNCEHLLDGAAQQAEALLRGCSSLRILATSRRPLAIAGETVLRLPPLPRPDAIRLFADRASAVDAEFSVAIEGEQVVARLCDRLDGLPLAIELAAARMKALSGEEILGRIDRRFELIAGGSRSTEPRQRSLAAALEWSFDLLEEEERTAWQWLSIFAGSFDLAGASAVLGGTAIEAVASLLDHSVLARYQRGAGSRYRMLETIRDFGRDRLASTPGDQIEIQGRFLAYLVALAEEIDRMQSLPGEEAGWAARLDEEHDNLRQALALGCEQAPAMALRLAAALVPFWDLHGHLYEGRAWLQKSLGASGEVTPVRGKRWTGRVGWPSGRATMQPR